MTTRRNFLTGLGAASLLPATGWADAGAPDYLSAARASDGGYRLIGLGRDGQQRFSLPLPGRGHAAAAHPTRPEAIAFARRPGNFAVVIDCAAGRQQAKITAPKGRHFYGHGTFSQDGRILFTAENDYDQAVGVIGLWDASRGYARMGELPAHGVGPHDLALMPDGQTLVVANGGIETHPDSGRTKLNIPVMRPNLGYVDLSGRLLEQVELPRALHKDSIRHLALRGDSLVCFAMQWQGPSTDHPPLLGLHRRGQSPRLLQAADADHRRLQGYAGSVALSGDGQTVAITSPRGGQTHLFAVESGAFLGSQAVTDVCGIGPDGTGFFYTSGSGETGRMTLQGKTARPAASVAWDNHLVPIEA